MELKREWKFVLALIIEILSVIFVLKYMNNITEDMKIFCISGLLFIENFFLFVSIDRKRLERL